MSTSMYDCHVMQLDWFCYSLFCVFAVWHAARVCVCVLCVLCQCISTVARSSFHCCSFFVSLSWVLAAKYSVPVLWVFYDYAFYIALPVYVGVNVFWVFTVMSYAVLLFSIYLRFYPLHSYLMSLFYSIAKSTWTVNFSDVGWCFDFETFCSFTMKPVRTVQIWKLVLRSLLWVLFLFIGNCYWWRIDNNVESWAPHVGAVPLLCQRQGVCCSDVWSTLNVDRGSRTTLVARLVSSMVSVYIHQSHSFCCLRTRRRLVYIVIIASVSLARWSCLFIWVILVYRLLGLERVCVVGFWYVYQQRDIVMRIVSGLFMREYWLGKFRACCI